MTHHQPRSSHVPHPRRPPRSGTPTAAARTGPTILLTSPWPESLHAFAPVWDSAGRGTPGCSPIDLPGFGRSERRDDLLSPRAMGGFLARLVDEAGLDRPYVVAPGRRHAGSAVRRR